MTQEKLDKLTAERDELLAKVEALNTKIEAIEDEDSNNLISSCDSCGKEENAHVAIDHWVSFSTGNVQGFTAVVCPDCYTQKEKMLKVLDFFLDNLGTKIA